MKVLSPLTGLTIGSIAMIVGWKWGHVRTKITRYAEGKVVTILLTNLIIVFARNVFTVMCNTKSYQRISMTDICPFLVMMMSLFSNTRFYIFLE
ncbi:MAG TPA: hypothetical protein DDX81_08965 [Desulfofustis sp.]|nr:hypothetical protein [Desulfofustis sp.]